MRKSFSLLPMKDCMLVTSASRRARVVVSRSGACAIMCDSTCTRGTALAVCVHRPAHEAHRKPHKTQASICVPRRREAGVRLPGRRTRAGATPAPAAPPREATARSTSARAAREQHSLAGDTSTHDHGGARGQALPAMSTRTSARTSGFSLRCSLQARTAATDHLASASVRLLWPSGRHVSACSGQAGRQNAAEAQCALIPHKIIALRAAKHTPAARGCGLS